MLFNAPEFLFLFLPLTWAAFAVLRRAGRLGAVLNLLLLASLVFYGVWEPKYLLLIGASIVGNFTLGSLIRSSVAAGRGGGGWLALGVAANLGVLGWFKYANFAQDNLERVLDLGWQLEPITLPLGISFFTFQQVAYLVDLRRGTLPPHGFRNYALFVVYFPQLIAGPIVHFRDLQPQFGPGLLATPLARRFAVGLTALALGLGKKVLIADRLAAIATPVFRAADDGLPVSAFEAWVGALAYTFQIYFDFSGYSDMAIGLSLMFGIAVAVNFRSPYRALSITDFWRRWHITLSAFLRDYLYIPLGGNRRGPFRQKLNLMLTMLLGGLWHGAGWNFMIWGGLHGGYLIVHQTVREFAWFKRLATVPGWRAAAWSLTFLAVVLAWVPFRAEATAGSLEMLRSMAFLDGFDLPRSAPIAAGLAERWITVDLTTCASLLLLALVLATRCPNTAQICGIDGGAPAWLRLAARPWQAVAVGILLAFALLSVGQPSEFLYFNF